MSRIVWVRLVPSLLLACACVAAAVLTSLGPPTSPLQGAIETALLGLIMIFADSLEQRLHHGAWTISPSTVIISIALTLAAAITAQSGSRPSGGVPPILIAAAWIALMWSASDGCETRRETRPTLRRSP